ncbi:MAG: hypothetical protein Edafosvirus48_1, partial [Edafosvirus sp.]
MEKLIVFVYNKSQKDPDGKTDNAIRHKFLFSKDSIVLDLKYLISCEYKKDFLDVEIRAGKYSSPNIIYTSYSSSIKDRNMEKLDFTYIYEAHFRSIDTTGGFKDVIAHPGHYIFNIFMTGDDSKYLQSKYGYKRDNLDIGFIVRYKFKEENEFKTITEYKPVINPLDSFEDLKEKACDILKNKIDGWDKTLIESIEVCRKKSETRIVGSEYRYESFIHRFSEVKENDPILNRIDENFEIIIQIVSTKLNYYTLKWTEKHNYDNKLYKRFEITKDYSKEDTIKDLKLDFQERFGYDYRKINIFNEDKKLLANN